MTAASAERARADGLTRADLDAMPQDGTRHELLDGLIVVTPAPSWEHQTTSMRLSAVLFNACPATLQVLSAPFDVLLANDTVLQPDILVAAAGDFRQRDTPAVPLLTVEIASPSTQRYDEHLKKGRYARAGVPSYWVIDPLSGRFTAWELDENGRYIATVDAGPDDRVDLTRPFPVTFTPGALLGRR